MSEKYLSSPGRSDPEKESKPDPGEQSALKD